MSEKNLLLKQSCNGMECIIGGKCSITVFKYLQTPTGVGIGSCGGISSSCGIGSSGIGSSSGIVGSSGIGGSYGGVLGIEVVY